MIDKTMYLLKYKHGSMFVIFKYNTSTQILRHMLD